MDFEPVVSSYSAHGQQGTIKTEIFGLHLGITVAIIGVFWKFHILPHHE